MKTLLTLVCSVYALVAAAVVPAQRCFDDPFADATLWIRAVQDENGDGVLQAGEFKSALANATPWSSLTVYNGVAVSNEWVAMPYRGYRTKLPTLYFAQPVMITNEVLNTGTGRIQTLNFEGFTPCVGVTTNSFTVALRFRPDSEQFRADYAWIFNWGYNNQRSGFNLGLTRHSMASKDLIKGTVTNRVTYRRYSLDFFKNGQTAQVFQRDGDIWGGRWHDLVLSVDGEQGKIRYLLCRGSWDPAFDPIDQGKASDGGGRNTYSNEVALTVAEGLNYTPESVLILGSENAASGVVAYTNNGAVPGNATKSFRGSIQQFAVWNRAMSYDEMHRTLAYPRGELMRAGVRDGTSDEFRGGTASEPDDATWTLPKSYAPGDTATVRFVADREGEGEMPQLLRWYPTSDSAEGAIRATLNGTDLGVRTVRPGHLARWTVKAGMVRDGTNTLVLARTDAGTGSVKPDAVALGGSWQIGHKNNSYSEFVHESSGILHHDVLNGNWRDIRRVLFGGTRNAAGQTTHLTNTVFHFTRPAEFTRDDYIWRLVWKDYSGDPLHQPRWDLNGHDLGYSSAADGRLHSLELPSELLLPGDNALQVRNAGVYTQNRYYSFDYFRLEIRQVNGTILLLR